MNIIKNIDYNTYILNLCKKVLDEKIAIDDEAKIMLNKILAANSLEIIDTNSSDIGYLIDFIMYYEDLEYPGIGDDLISYALRLNKSND